MLLVVVITSTTEAMTRTIHPPLPSMLGRTMGAEEAEEVAKAAAKVEAAKEKVRARAAKLPAIEGREQACGAELGSRMTTRTLPRMIVHGDVLCAKAIPVKVFAQNVFRHAILPISIGAHTSLVKRK